MSNTENRPLYELVIGIPTSGMVDWRFTSSLMGLQLPGNTRVIWQVRSMIDTARNSIVKTFLNGPGKYLLMIDDDMTFDPDFVLKLIEHDVDIVGGLAFKRRPDFHPCVYRQNKKNKNYYPILPEVFQEVDIVGTGGMLIKLDVLKKLKEPWFTTGYDEKNIHWSVDFNFCKLAKKEGFKVFVDPEAEMGHIGDSPVIKKVDFIKTLNKQKNECS